MKNNRYNNLLVSKELEYSQENTKFIDNRIWKVCEEAASNYEKIQNTFKQKEQIKKFDIILEDRKSQQVVHKNNNPLNKPENESERFPNFYKFYENESSSYINLDDTVKDIPEPVKKPQNKMLISNGNNVLFKTGINYSKKQNEVVRSTNELFNSNKFKSNELVLSKETKATQNNAHNHKVGKLCIPCELKKK
jgi:hypothetical protein